VTAAALNEIGLPGVRRRKKDSVRWMKKAKKGSALRLLGIGNWQQLG
jgi:hypothetical protein